VSTATEKQPQPESTRLESMWAGKFGDDYLERNRAAGDTRGPFWNRLLDTISITSALEVGCNVGANLRWLADRLGPAHVYGVDINVKTLAALRQTHPGINAVLSPGRELPFRDRWFDLAFTAGVLIHQPESTLPLMMSEIVRCSNRYVLSAEYCAMETTEVPYRGVEGALFKRDYGRIYRELFPGLKMIDQGFLSHADGWDDVTWWLYERS
jgi:pseudaminic acid biosynthesis-associated methylase